MRPTIAVGSLARAFACSCLGCVQLNLQSRPVSIRDRIALQAPLAPAAQHHRRSLDARRRKVRICVWVNALQREASYALQSVEVPRRRRNQKPLDSNDGNRMQVRDRLPLIGATSLDVVDQCVKKCDRISSPLRHFSVPAASSDCHRTHEGRGSCTDDSTDQTDAGTNQGGKEGIHEQTSVRRRGGAVCNRHQRWHIDGADIDLTPFPEYAHAERCLSGTLWKRGIGLTTGELQLAASLIRYWSIEERAEGRIADRMATIGVDSLDADNVFLAAYPEIVRLTTIITDLSFASYLLSPRFSLAEQVWALEAAVVTVMNGCTTPRLHQVAERIVARGKLAVETAFGMRQNAHNTRPANLEKALIASSQRHRSCLLRHLSTVRIQILPYTPGVAVPSSRVLSRRRSVPDLADESAS